MKTILAVIFSFTLLLTATGCETPSVVYVPQPEPPVTFWFSFGQPVPYWHHYHHYYRPAPPIIVRPAPIIVQPRPHIRPIPAPPVHRPPIVTPRPQPHNRPGPRR